jgi:uncharacterized damage-inducible protein DinB
MLDEIRRMWEHARWADRIVFAALQGASNVPGEAWREYSHILGADEVWLARLEQRASRAVVWPTLTPSELEALNTQVHSGYAAYMAGLTETAFRKLIPYTNTAGQSFTTAVGDILLHVALHAQYHRGKINLLLRQAGLMPAPTDFIAFVRGVPAATSGSVKPTGRSNRG